MGARMIPFGGWEMPVEYIGLVKEHTAVREAAGLFDVSHMGEFRITGAQALDLVQHVTCNDAARLEDGQAQYSALPTPEGTVVDDVLVYRKSAAEFMMVVNAANIEGDLQWIKSHNAFDARVEDISASLSLLALQGPRALDILQPLTSTQLNAISPYHFIRGSVLAVDAILSRTGYTGEDGIEIYFAAQHSEHIWNGILEAGRPLGLLPAGLGARNTLRLEAKLLLYGNDMDRTTNLIEAGLGWIVKLYKGDFIGRDALRRQKEEGVRRRLVGFEMLGREIAREHYPVLIDGHAASQVASGSPSITLKKNIGLTYLPIEHAAVGSRFQIEVRGRACDAQVAATPFYKRR
jgi:aminomethyltransferase